MYGNLGGILFSMLIMACGLLMAAQLMRERHEIFRKIIDKLHPYQELIGVVLLIWCLLNSLDALRALRVVVYAPLFVLTSITATFLGAIVGAFLAYPQLQRLFSSSPNTQTQLRRYHAKIETYQTPLGVALFVVGLILCIKVLQYL